MLSQQVTWMFLDQSFQNELIILFKIILDKTDNWNFYRVISEITQTSIMYCHSNFKHHLYSLRSSNWFNSLREYVEWCEQTIQVVVCPWSQAMVVLGIINLLDLSGYIEEDNPFIAIKITINSVDFSFDGDLRVLYRHFSCEIVNFQLGLLK